MSGVTTARATEDTSLLSGRPMASGVSGVTTAKETERTTLLSGDVDASGARPWFVCDLAIIGPGLFVSLADTDFACLIEAAKSGARFEFSFLMGLQLLLFPVLFMTQELTVRLGAHTHQGHGACIRAHYGVTFSWVAFGLLSISCALSTMSQLAGIIGVANICGLNAIWSAYLASIFLIALVLVCPYHVVERVGICFGLFELSFVVAAFLSDVQPDGLWAGLFRFENEPEFARMAAANVGAVIMPWVSSRVSIAPRLWLVAVRRALLRYCAASPPWFCDRVARARTQMIYFQQSAVAAKQIRTGREEAVERTGTLCGSVVTQCVMLGTMITYAASRDAAGIYQIENARAMNAVLMRAFGDVLGRVLCAMGLLGGSICASIVAALANSWALVDALGPGTGARRPPMLPAGDARATARLEDRPSNPMDASVRDAPIFYGVYTATVLLGFLVTMAGITQQQISLLALVANAFLMPITLAFLWLLATGSALPERVRVQGLYKWLAATVFMIASTFAIVEVVRGMAFASWFAQHRVEDEGEHEPTLGAHQA